MTQQFQMLCMALLMLFPGTQAIALELRDLEHIHGLAFESGASNNLLLATHRGMFRVRDDGSAERVSKDTDDYMSLASSASEPGVLFASGHPVTGGNLGLLKSTDGGRSWAHWSDGANGPADFHYLAVSPADPSTLYGVSDALQVSRDGGRNWQVTGHVPPGLLTLAISSTSPDMLYAATERGLLLSRDSGSTWLPALLVQSPTSVIEVRPDGQIIAFIVGSGLVQATEPTLAWRGLFDGFGAQVPLTLALHDSDPLQMAVLTQNEQILLSRDGGTSWRRVGIHERLPSNLESTGKALYVDFCQACHGLNGVGQNFALPKAGEQQFVAPALDDSMHAWHHTDEALRKTIMEGSPRTTQMPGWQGVLSDDDVTAVIAYMKSLWTPREIACQGAKHMNCPKDAGQ